MGDSGRVPGCCVEEIPRSVAKDDGSASSAGGPSRAPWMVGADLTFSAEKTAYQGDKRGGQSWQARCRSSRLVRGRSPSTCIMWSKARTAWGLHRI